MVYFQKVVICRMTSKDHGVYCHSQQNLSYIKVVNFIGGGNWRKSLTNFIT